MSINHSSGKNGEAINIGSKNPSSEGHLWFRQQQQPGAIGKTWETGRDVIKQQSDESDAEPRLQQNSNRERRKALRAAPVDEEDYP